MSDDQDDYVRNPADVRVVKVVPLPHARSEVWSFFGFIADDDGEIQDKKRAICKLCATQLSYSGNTTNLFTHLKAMHPEVNPQKLAPTNRTPRTGRKMARRRVINGVISHSMITGNSQVEGSSPSSTQYVIHVNESDTASANLLEEESHSINNDSDIAKSEKISTFEETDGTMDFDQVDQSGQKVVTSEHITNALIDMLVKDFRPTQLVEGKGFQDFIKLLAPGYQIPERGMLDNMYKKRMEEYRKSLVLRGMGNYPT